jgi:hypothetical protein
MSELLKFFTKFDSITFVQEKEEFYVIIEQKNGETHTINDNDIPVDVTEQIDMLKKQMIEDNASFFMIEKDGFLSVITTAFDREENLIYSKKYNIFTILKNMT